MADGTGEAADLQRRDDHHGQTLCHGGSDEGLFEAAGGLDDDALEAVTTKATEERGDGVLLVWNAKHSVSLKEIDIERCLTHIDADVHGRTLLCHVSSALLNSGSGAHSTVRVDTKSR